AGLPGEQLDGVAAECLSLQQGVVMAAGDRQVCAEEGHGSPTSASMFAAPPGALLLFRGQSDLAAQLLQEARIILGHSRQTIADLQLSLRQLSHGLFDFARRLSESSIQ